MEGLGLLACEQLGGPFRDPPLGRVIFRFAELLLYMLTNGDRYTRRSWCNCRESAHLLTLSADHDFTPQVHVRIVPDEAERDHG